MFNPPSGLSALGYVGAFFAIGGLLLALAGFGSIIIDKPIKTKRNRKLGYTGIIISVLGLGFLFLDRFYIATPANGEKPSSETTSTPISIDVQIIDPLNLLPANLNDKHQLIFTVEQPITATFRMRNVGNTTAHFEAFGVGIRGPNICPLKNQWEGGVYDFESVTNFTLQPDDEYTYEKQKSFYAPGVYFAEPIAKVPGRDNWVDILPNQRIYFIVQGNNTETVTVDTSCVTPVP
jgi:hypothetical protein